ncbi:MAG TPA: hypothetical protein DCG49_10075, partial [Ruminococcus sp.]|nr:hypothetical protein [Ruminococcus sp.]
MNKTLKGIIAGSAVLAALCGAVVVLKMTEPEETSEESSQTGVSTELWHTHSDDILEVTVDNPNGDSYTAYQKKETMKSTDMDGNPTEEEVSNYYLKGYDELPMNTVDIRLLATRAPEVFSTDLVQEHVSDADLSKYGLDAAVKVTYKVADGENISFLIGGETPVDGCRYLMMDGQDTVYSVSSSLLEPFMKGIHDYLGTALTEAQAEDDDTIIESV